MMRTMHTPKALSTTTLSTAIALIAMLLAAPTTATAADAPSNNTATVPVGVGVSAIDITPQQPIRLAGYGNRNTESKGVAQNLWAKAIAVGGDTSRKSGEDGGGESGGGPAVLVMVENCIVPMALIDRAAERLHEQTGLNRDRFTVTVTHTHNGPVIRNAAQYHFGKPLPAEHQKRVDEYTAKLKSAIERAAIQALENRAPGRLAWAEGEVGFAVNRRVIRDGKWAGFGINPDGPVDHDLPVFRVTAPDGSLRALLLSYACHCTTFGGRFNQIHGDWAGSAMKMLEQRHPDATALVAIGCGADQNPEPRGGTPEQMLAKARAHGKTVADEVDRLLATDMKPIDMKATGGAPQCRLRRIDLPYQQIPSRSQWEQWAKRTDRLGFYAKNVIKQLEQGGSIPKSLPYPVQTWTFGDDLGMVFLAGEVVVDYSLRLKDELDADRLWVNAYANGVPCYIPSKRILPQGGYEVDSSQYSYGRPSRFAPVTEDRIITTVHDLLPDTFAAEP